MCCAARPTTRRCSCSTIYGARADLDRHFEEPNLRAFLAQQEELLAAPLDMRNYATLPE
jgi:hypothetical protein